MIRTAHLRVYTPVSDVDMSGLVPGGVDISLSRFGLVAEPLDESPIIIEWEGATHICPRTSRLRVLEGVLAVRRAYGALGGATVVPDDIASAAREELEALHRRSPELRSHILTSPWHVPARWFVLFDASEREVYRADGEIGLRYRTSFDAAVERVKRALDVLEGVDLPESVGGDVGELRSWLLEFENASLVELDYGTVSGMFAEEVLEEDDSVERVWTAIEALEAGDFEGAAENYGALVYRWSPAIAIAYSS